MVFWLFLIGEILSIPCYLFVFYHLLFNKVARKSLHNHSIIILLFYNFLNLTIDLSLTQSFTLLGYVLPFSPAHCLIWRYVDNGIWYGGVFLMLWASFERHILIFHSNLVQNLRGRIFFHYIPLGIFSLYAPILYFYLIIIIPCDETYDKTIMHCGVPCFYDVIPYWFSVYDTFADYIIPILLIVVFSVSLFLRFLKQKRKLQQNVTWRQCRKMFIQLMLVSVTYLLFDLPFVIIFLVRQMGDLSFGSDILSPYIASLTLVPAIILPYATLLALPDSKNKLYALCFWRRNRNLINPTTRLATHN
jgi:hypothetical protein